MIQEILQIIPPDIIKFLLVTLFALLIGLEQRRHYIKAEFETLFGTDRTFTLIGIFGFVLYVISPENLIPFMIGGIIISVLLAIFYLEKIRIHKFFGMTSIITALITYCLAPLIYRQPEWLVLLIVISVLVLTEIKETLFEFSKKFEHTEFITLAKFLAIAGVVLPLLPDKPLSSQLNVSPYKLWMAIVAVAGVSYLSYILKKFVFPQSGILLTGVLGGLYSSTATTIILSRKSREFGEKSIVIAAIFLATTMMYLRILILALFFNKDIAFRLAPAFGILIVVSFLISFYFWKFKQAITLGANAVPQIASHGNPLEFKTSVVFGALFVVFALATGFVVKYYGAVGIKWLSFIVGVTDIDPFIINLFQSKWDIGTSFLAAAVLNASSSNNLLKMIYGTALSDNLMRKGLIAGFSILVILGLIISYFVSI